MLCYRARVERTDVLLCSVAGLPNIHCIPIEEVQSMHSYSFSPITGDVFEPYPRKPRDQMKRMCTVYYDIQRSVRTTCIR